MPINLKNISGILIIGLLATGCGTDSYEKVTIDMFAKMRELTKLLHAVQNEEDAKRVATEMPQWIDEMLEIKARGESLTTAPSVKAEMKKKYQAELQEVASDCFGAMNFVSRHRKYGKHLRELMKTARGTMRITEQRR